MGANHHYQNEVQVLIENKKSIKHQDRNKVGWTRKFEEGMKRIKKGKNK